MSIPPAQMETPLLKTFWRRFWPMYKIIISIYQALWKYASWQHCWVPVSLWRNYAVEWEASRKVRNPGYLKALWRNRESNHKRPLIAKAPHQKVTKVRDYLLCEP